MRCGLSAACGIRAPADIMFALPLGANQHHQNCALRFIRHLVSDFDISPEGVRVGMVPQECTPHEGFRFSDTQDKSEILSWLQETHTTKKGTASVIKAIRTQDFRHHYGHVSVKRFGVLIVDSIEDNAISAILESQWAQLENGVELFVVAVGKKVSSRQVELLASHPVADHVVYASSYDDLHNVADELLEKLNEYCAGKWGLKNTLKTSVKWKPMSTPL